MTMTFNHIAMLGAFTGLAALSVSEVDARGRGGGGMARGGASTSISRGGGGGGSGFSRSGSYSRPSAVQQPSRGGSNRLGSSGQRQNASLSQRPSQQPAGGNRNNVQGGNRTTINGGNTNINTGNINTGNVNVNRNVHVDNTLPHGYYGGWRDYPIARGVAIGAVAGVTAAAIGSAYYALPPACSPYVWQTYTYYSCSGAYYRPQYQGDTVVYVTVPKPG